jgi:integrase
MSGTKRRGHGEGSISLRKDGRWSAIISLENGKRKTFYGKTKKEVRDKLQAALLQVEQQAFVGTSQQKLGDFLAQWLEDTHKYRLRQRTYERYDQILRLHLIPGLGHHPIQKLAPQHLQAFYKHKLEDGLSKSTVGTFHNVLHKALDTALRWGLVSRNVSELVTPPRKEHYEIQPLCIEQVQQLLKALPGNPLEVLFLLALGTGMRQGEILALKWQDIDLMRGTLQVRRVLTHITVRLRKVGEPSFIETEPKTERGRRSLALPEVVLQALIAHKEQQAVLIRDAGRYWQHHDYVFCTKLGKHLTPNYVVTTFKSLLKKAGLPNIRFHDLRHTAATTLLALGVNPKIVQEMLGHTEISMTMDIYSHVLPTMQKEAMYKLNTALWG